MQRLLPLAAAGVLPVAALSAGPAAADFCVPDGPGSPHPDPGNPQDNWLGGAGRWGDPSLWSDYCVPRGARQIITINGSGGDFITFDAAATATGHVTTLRIGPGETLSQDANFEQLTLGGIVGNSLGVGVLNNSGTLTFGGAGTDGTLVIDITPAGRGVSVTETNNGVLNLLNGSTLSLADSGNKSNFAWSGLGTINLSGSSTIVGATGDELLSNNGNTIQGTGTVQTDLVNGGKIIANVAEQVLKLDPTGLSSSPGVLSTGIMQVSSGGEMDWETRLYGGTSVAAPAFANTGTVAVADGGFLAIRAVGGTAAFLNNNGAITIGTSAGATLRLDSQSASGGHQGTNATFDIGSTDRTGVIALNNATVFGRSGTETLINDGGAAGSSTRGSSVHGRSLMSTPTDGSTKTFRQIPAKQTGRAAKSLPCPHRI